MSEGASQAATKVILVRHGQSMANAGAKTADHFTNPLTDLGHIQAVDFAEQVDCNQHSLSFRHSVSTTNGRTTAAEIPRCSGRNSPFIVHFSRALAPQRHKRRGSTAARVGLLGGKTIRSSGPGAESFTQFLDRAREAIHRLVSGRRLHRRLHSRFSCRPSGWPALSTRPMRAMANFGAFITSTLSRTSNH